MSADPSTPIPVTDRLVIDFDHYSPEYRDNWPAICDENLAKCPVAHSPHHGGFWVVSDYVSVTRVMRDDTAFASIHHAEDPDTERPDDGTPRWPVARVATEFDPPLHSRYRRLLNPYFAPTAADELEPFVRQTVDALLDRVCASGRIDFVRDLGNPVPMLAVMKLVGLPLEHWQRYAEPLHGLLAFPTGGAEHRRCVAAVEQLGVELRALVPARREQPGEGLLGALARATVEDRRLTDDEVAQVALLVLQGGVDPTTALLGNALAWLAEHPDQRQRLIDRPPLLEHATEEFLRAFTPVPALARTATADVRLAGQQLRAGDRVLMSFAAANRDPDVFPDPGEVKLDRAPNPHTSFGLGLHRCIGSNLARSWFRLMLGRVLERMPDYTVDRAAARRYESIGIVNGFVDLPATFTPSEPVGASLPG
ncbi:cytochrome P450 [Micromonospora sp. NPDC049559]|uniref:cytochrome P450 n=1 Tax=Micromonospora sp. NPDC049559 TaxID=3155923 RepID=UPI00343B6D48